MSETEQKDGESVVPEEATPGADASPSGESTRLRVEPAGTPAQRDPAQRDSDADGSASGSPFDSEHPADGASERVSDGQASDVDEAKGEDAPSDVVEKSPVSQEADPGVAVPPSVVPRDIRVTYFGMTDVGRVREHNEDNFMVSDLSNHVRGTENGQPRSAVMGNHGLVFAVCDGMGGAAAGEVASQMAVDATYDFFSQVRPPEDRDHFATRVVTAVEEAGALIFKAAKADRTRRGMGTTATVAGLVDQVLFVGQVGDSRAYVLRDGKLGLITKDQSLVNQLIEAGQLTEAEAQDFEHSNIILQALGTTEDVVVDLTFLALRRGDRLMMCSDGLSGLVTDDVIREVMSSEKGLVECCSRLIECANAGGGDDNITVVCADFEGESLELPEEGDEPNYQQYPLPEESRRIRESFVPREERLQRQAAGVDRQVVREPLDPSPTKDRPAPGPMRWVALAAGLLLVVSILAVFAMGNGSDAGSSDATEQGESAGSEDVARPVGALEPRGTGEAPRGPVVQQLLPATGKIEIRVGTVQGGELWIAGQNYASIEPRDELVLELAPGAYLFEVRVEGVTRFSRLVEMKQGAAGRVVLGEVPDDVAAVGSPEDDLEEVLEGSGQEDSLPLTEDDVEEDGASRGELSAEEPSADGP